MAGLFDHVPMAKQKSGGLFDHVPMAGNEPQPTPVMPAAPVEPVLPQGPASTPVPATPPVPPMPPVPAQPDWLPPTQMVTPEAPVMPHGPGVDPGPEATWQDDLKAGMLLMEQLGPGLRAAGDIGSLNRALDVADDAEARRIALLAEADALEAELGNLDPESRAMVEDEIRLLRQRAVQMEATMNTTQDERAIADLAGEAAIIGELNKEIQGLPISDTAVRIQEGGWGDAFSALLDDPIGAMRTFGLRSLPASAPSIVGGVLGQLVGGPVGAAIGGGAGGFGVEMGLSVSQDVAEALGEAGVDATNPEAVENFALQNPEVFGDVVTRALVRAGVIGAADAVTMGISGSVATALRNSGKAARIGGAAATGTVVEPFGEMAGELGAQVATGDEVRPGEVIAEGIGGLTQGGPTAVGQTIAEGFRNPDVVRAFEQWARGLDAMQPPPAEAVAAQELRLDRPFGGTELQMTPAQPIPPAVDETPIIAPPVNPVVPNSEEEPPAQDAEPQTPAPEAPIPQAEEPVARPAPAQAVPVEGTPVPAPPAPQKRPLTNVVKRYLPIDPTGPVGQELQYMGVTPRTAPGLFRRGGYMDLDNIVASEYADLDELVGRDDTGMYLNQQNIVQALIDEAQGRPWQTAEQKAVQRAWDDYHNMANEARDELARNRVVGDLDERRDFVPFPEQDITAGTEERYRRIETAINMVEQEMQVRLTSVERRLIQEQLDREGGFVEDAIADAITRSVLNAEAGEPIVPVDTVAAAVRGGAERPGQQPVQPPAGEAGAGAPARAGEPQRQGTAEGGAIDITPEGEQLVIPGAEQITDRERAERKQQEAKRGGDAPPPAGGLFDDDARNQDDLFAQQPTETTETPTETDTPPAEAPRGRTFRALLNGIETTARKRGGRWMVGGDFDTNGALIELERDGRPAWYALKGNRLVFQDWVSPNDRGRDLEQEAEPRGEVEAGITAWEEPISRATEDGGTEVIPEVLEEYERNPVNFVARRILSDLAPSKYGGKRTREALQRNIGSPVPGEVNHSDAIIDAALDGLIDRGLITKSGQSYMLAEAPAQDAPVTLTDEKLTTARQDPEEGPYTDLTFSDGRTARIARLDSGESGGLAGWHRVDGEYGIGLGNNSYLADRKDEAIAKLTEWMNENPQSGKKTPKDEGGTLEERGADAGARIGRRPPGKLSPTFLHFSFNNRPSVFQSALRDAGIDPEEARLMDVDEQVRRISGMIEEKFGVKIELPTQTYLKRNIVGRKVKVTKTSITNREALDQLLDAYQNMSMLAHVMGVPETAIGLPIKGEGITLSLVSTGRLRGALGMFSWGNGARSITLPGRSNSFAHEWGHALDHYLNNVINKPSWKHMITRSQSAKGMTRLYPENTPKAMLTEAFAHVIWAMYGDRSKVAALALELQVRAAKTDPDGQPTNDAKRAIDMLKNMEDGTMPPRDLASQYLVTSENFDEAMNAGGYFVDPAEMFARAFEAWVGRSVAAVSDLPQSFLSKGQWAYDDTNDRRLANTFPKGGDADQFAIAMTKLSGALSSANMFGEEAPAPAPTDVVIHKPQELLKTKPGKGLTQREADEIKSALGRLKAFLKASTSREAYVQGFKGLRTFYQTVISTGGHAMYMVALRQENAKARDALMNIVRQVAKVSPGRGIFQGSIYQQELERKAKRRVMMVSNAVKEHFGGLRLKKDDLRVVRSLLIGERVQSNDKQRALAGDLRQILNEIWYELKEAGVKVGYAKDFLPYIYDKARIDADPQTFKRKARQVYRLLFQREIIENGDPETQAKDIFALLNGTQTEEGLLKATKATSEGDRAPRPYLDEDDMKLVDDWRRLRGQLRDMERKLKRGEYVDEDAARERIAAKQEEVQEALDAMMPMLQARYAEAATDRWYIRLGVGQLNDFEHIGPNSSFLKGRVLPKETGAILSEFMIEDPIDLISGYAFSAARIAEYAKRFGAKHEKLENMLEAARDAGTSTEDLDFMKKAVQAATGRMVPSTSGWSKMRQITFTLGNLSMLGLATFTSLSESAVAGMRTGRTRDGLWAFVEAARALRRGRREELKDLASVVGLIAPYTMETVMENRLSADALDMPRWMRETVGRFFIANGLTPLTQFQRTAMTPVAHATILRLLRDNVRGKRTVNSRLRDVSAGGKGQFANNELNELGISQDFREDLLSWIESLDGLPQVDDMYANDGSLHPAAELYARALSRLVEEIIQNPLKTDRPIQANHPDYAALYGIMSFIDGFTRNVLLRNLYRGVKSEDRWHVAGVKMTYNTALAAAPFGVLLAGHMLTTILREALLNEDKWDELEEEGELEEWLFKRAFFRTGITGRLDPLIQMGVGIKYERDLTAITAGPYLSYQMQNMQRIYAAFAGRNSDNTNTAEYNAMRAAYSLLVQPLANIALSNLGPMGPLSVNILTRPAIINASAYDSSAKFAESLVGEKGTQYDKAGIPTPWWELGD